MSKIIVALLLTAACTTAEHADQTPAPSGQIASRASAITDSSGGTVVSHDSATTQTTAAARATSVDQKSSGPIRALYVNRWATQSRKRMAKLIAAADSTEINALVLDING